MKVLVTGGGQLAWELAKTVPASVELITAPRDILDITDSTACYRVFQEHQPSWVINTAAYTAVDRAEQETDQAFSVNEQGAGNIAQACKSTGARLIHVSTDFVFDGRGNTPYTPGAAVNPLSVYGSSKLAGEKAITAVLPDAIIMRTSWLYSTEGANFVKTMLRLMAEKPQLNVVADQVGSPTWARGLAKVLWRGVTKHVAGGVYHWSDAGVASWYDFAVTIHDVALELDLLKAAVPIRPILTAEYPTPAKRPKYSVLDASKTLDAFEVSREHWQDHLKAMLTMLA